MIVVADSTIVIRLGRVGRLELLRQLYSSVTIPPRVWEEVTVDGRGQPGANALIEAHQAGWIMVTPPANPTDVDTLLQRHGGLDRGEAEAMVIAIDHNPSLLLIDENQGYTTAKRAFGRYMRVAAMPHVLDEGVRAGLLTRGE